MYSGKQHGILFINLKFQIMKKLISIVILLSVWAEIGLSQCNFFPSFSPDPRPQYNSFHQKQVVKLLSLQ